MDLRAFLLWLFENCLHAHVYRLVVGGAEGIQLFSEALKKVVVKCASVRIRIDKMKKIQESEQTCKQIGWITSLRALTTVSVVMIHVISGWLGEDTKALDLRVLFDLVGIQLVVRWAVPVFGMISGYLLLNPNKSMPIEKIFRYLNKMLLALLFFALPFCIIENVVSNSFNVTMALMVKSLIDWLSGHSWAHMWYVYTMAGMYIVLPLLRSFTKSATKKEVEVVLLGLFIFTSVIPTVNSVLHQEFINLIPVNSCIFSIS